MAVLRDKLMLEREEQVVEFHTWRSSAGKEVRRREDHVGGNLLDVSEACCDAASTFFSRQSVSASLVCSVG